MFKRLPLLLSATVLFLLTACESSPPSATDPAPAQATPTQQPEALPTAQPTETPAGHSIPAGSVKLVDGKLVIAVINDQSGIYADFGGKNVIEAVKMAVEDFEAKYGRGILGGAIEVVSADHRNTPETAVARAQELIDRNGADLLLDAPASSTALRLMKVAAEKKRVYINVSAATAELTGKECNRYTFHYAYDVPMLSAAADWATRNVGRKWHLIYPKYGFGQEMESAFRKTIEVNGGAVLSSDPSPFPHPTGDFTDLLRRTIAHKPDVFGVLQTGGDLANVVRDYNALKLRDQHIPLVVGLLFETDIHTIGADALAGALFATPWHWSMDREAREWAERFTKRTGARPTFAHAGNYSAAWQYLEAVSHAGTDQADAVVKALEGRRFDDFFIRNGTIRAEDHFVVHDVVLAQVKAKSEAKEPWDYVKVVAILPADKAVRPAAESGCHMPK